MRWETKRAKFSALLSSFKSSIGGNVEYIPVFVSLTNSSRMKHLVKDLNGRKPGGHRLDTTNVDGVGTTSGGGNDGCISQQDSICCMLRKNGFVRDQLLKAMVVYDEADQDVNINVSDDTVAEGINKVTKAIFTDPRAVGKLDDVYGDVLEANSFFDLFTANLDVTATPHSLLYSKRDLTSRKIQRLITGSPSKHGFQYETRLGWKSKLIDRMDVQGEDGVPLMIDHMLADTGRNRHAAVVDKTVKQKADQRTQALRYAARYGDHRLITATWSADGVSVFTRYDVDDNANDEEIDSDDEGGMARNQELEVVESAFNFPGALKTSPDFITLYLAPEDTWRDGDEQPRCDTWETEDGLRSRLGRAGGRFKFATEEITKAKASAESTERTASDGSVETLYNGWREVVLEERVRAEVKKNNEAILRDVVAKTRKTTIAIYTDDRGSYPMFIDRLNKVMVPVEGKPHLSAYSDLKLNTVVFGKDIMDRGVTVKGATSHACDLTDMYVRVEAHYTLLIQVCGRLCGNHYHKKCNQCENLHNQVRSYYLPTA